MDYPTQEGVLGNLHELRRYEGLTYDSASRALHIHWTRIVENELKLGTSEDRYATAHDVVRCVAGSAKLLGKQISRVATVLLNCDQDQSPRVGQRREDLMAELGVGKDALARTEKIAFEQLAGVLMRLSASPCGSGATSEDQDAARVGASWDVYTDAELEARRLILSAFGLLRLSKSDSDAREHAREILELIPNGMSFFGATDDDPRRLLRVVLEKVTRAEYRRWVTHIPERRYSFGDEMLLDYLGTLDQIGGIPDSQSTARLRDQLPTQATLADIGVQDQVAADAPLDELGRTFRKLLDMSLEVVLTIVIGLEVADDWPSIDAPGLGVAVARQ